VYIPLIKYSREAWEGCTRTRAHQEKGVVQDKAHSLEEDGEKGR